MADSVSSLGYIGKSETKRFVKADKVESKVLSASDQPGIVLTAYFNTVQTLSTSGSADIVKNHGADYSKGDVKYNNSTGIFTINTPGLYALHGQVRFTANNSGRRRVYIADPTATFRPYADQMVQAVIGFDTVLECHGYAYLTAGQTVALYALQESGGPLTINDPGPGHINVIRLY